MGARQQAHLSLPSKPVAEQRKGKATWNDARDASGAHFFTIGYAGRTANDLAQALQTAGVATLLDVRHNAVSMFKPEFSKTNLRDRLRTHDIQYLHVPQLGVPRDVRGLAVGMPTRDEIWNWYDRHVVWRFAGRNLDWFFNLADHPVAFMCAELDPTDCHRHRLAVALQRHGLQHYDL